MTELRIEGMVRQRFLRGSGAKFKDIIQGLKDEEIAPRDRMPTARRIASWLKEKGTEVIY
jgi:hypothetical protein